MFRIVIGIAILFGLSGGVENSPPNVSWSYIWASIFVFCLGIGCLISGIKELKK